MGKLYLELRILMKKYFTSTPESVHCSYTKLWEILFQNMNVRSKCFVCDVAQGPCLQLMFVSVVNMYFRCNKMFNTEKYVVIRIFFVHTSN